ncbi:MAG TPA: Fur family transcriptional regulator [Vulgatibacter sp.]|nr:Fur family transcriptional regulator [Vulgatibacter sp.]
MRSDSRDHREAAESPERILARYMAERGLKSTRQRSLVLSTFFQAGGHLNVEELLARIREVDPKVSAATVYRTMKLLTESGIAHARHFGDGQTRFEIATDHHDHLICTECGTIVEFEDQRIEDLQLEVARRHGFTVTDHKMELYGKCSACAAKPRTA